MPLHEWGAMVLAEQAGVGRERVSVVVSVVGVEEMGFAVRMLFRVDYENVVVVFR